MEERVGKSLRFLEGLGGWRVERHGTTIALGER